MSRRASTTCAYPGDHEHDHNMCLDLAEEAETLRARVAALEAELGRRRNVQRQTRPTLPVDADGIHADSNTIVPRY